jgi:Fe2+ transport system protein B
MEPMDDYARMINSVKNAITVRNEKKNTYILALMDVENKNNALKKIQTTPGKESQVPAKEQALANVEEHRDLTKREYEQVTERLLQEFEGFKAKKSIDLKEIMNNFITIQVSGFFI